MTLQEMHEKRTKLLHDAQVIMLQETVTAENRASVDAMLADVDVLEADIARSERVAVVDTENRSTRSLPRAVPGANADNSVEARNDRQKNAFDKLIRGGIQGLNAETRERFASVEQRDIIEASTGGTLIPQAFYPELLEAEKAWGDLLTIVKQIKSDDGRPTKYAMSNDTSAVMYEETEGTADANAAEDPVLTGALINTSLLSCPPILVGWAELQDSAFDITSFVRDILGKRYFRSLSAMCVNGSPSGNIASILTGVAAAAPVNAAVSATVTYVDIAALFGALDPAYIPNSTFVMNSTTRGALLGEVNTLGNPIFTPSASVTADPFGSLLGRPVKLVQALPNIGLASPVTATYPILFGDFNAGYLLRTVNPSLSVNVLKELYAAQFATGFIPFARAGSAFISPGGTHAIIGLKTV
ncbi:MAG: phage major capsid protein [Terracidiphilus sp.]